ncbi:MAG: hypothetical protein K0S09_9 [Sphingobacteriaceae bacterium]|jgi:hypothetical protein|nr:hypothetical protein [Sphingobacteriaceae bacterium]
MKQIFFKLLLLSLSLGFLQPSYGQQAFFHSQNKASVDADAKAFITAAGITDAGQKTAINNLVVAAKAHGWWSKCVAIYPIIGGSASTHKYNLKDPRDLDAAYRLTFSGTITHNSQGMKGDGSTAFADTHIVPTVNLTFNSTHISYYGFSNSTKSNSTEIGAYNGGGVQELAMVTRRSSGTYFSGQYDETGSYIIGTVASGIGYFLSNRTNATTHRMLKDGTLLGSNTVSTGTSTPPTVSIYIMAMHYPAGGGTVAYSDSGCEFATVGAGLTTGEEAAQLADITQFHNAR